ncbi:MAG: hypothetical protein ACQEQM_06075 [Thermoplasmatota archaeon]
MWVCQLVLALYVSNTKTENVEWYEFDLRAFDESSFVRRYGLNPVSSAAFTKFCKSSSSVLLPYMTSSKIPVSGRTMSTSVYIVKK